MHRKLSTYHKALIVKWLRSIFQGNGDEGDKSTKFILATPLIINFTFEVGATPVCE